MKSLSDILGPVHQELIKVTDYLESIKRTEDQCLAKVFDNGLIKGGKQIRPSLVLLASKYHNYDLDSIIPMAASIELLHMATLVHDDVIDNSSIRHGRPSVNNIRGNKLAVLLGDFLLSKAGEICAGTDNLRVTKLFTRTMAMMAIGELNQISDAFNPEQTQERYLDRIYKKTASMFVLATESGAILSQAPEMSIEILREYGYNFGMAFQIIDDIMDIQGTEKQLGKPVGSDLDHGILTLPTLLIQEHYGKDNPIKKYLENRGGPKEKERVIDIIHNSAVIQECYNIAGSYCVKACQNINQLPHNSCTDALRELAFYIVRSDV